MRSSQVVIPELDVMLKAFSRQEPEPAIVTRLTQLIDDRLIYFVGWVRQGLLTRARDERQFQRLLSALAPFPDIPIEPRDHTAAAQLTHRLRDRGETIMPAQALLWVMAERLHALVWSTEKRWRKLSVHGAPLFK